ncbi:MAG: peptide chain release factor N(5)-glutamine methyltransferase [Deltaproteobacteria bacterium]|nr:peptide chain release factor N(5)-glutamine methyltransferase [Deltaproteobacteria bacterium]
MKIWRVMNLIKWTTEYFQGYDIESARLDAELLLGHLLNKSRLQLYLDFEQVVDAEYLAQYRELIKKRVERIPVAYLINHKEFMSLNFYVDENVLIPRPETEVLVEAVLIHQSDDCEFTTASSTSLVVVEVGTGSGAIAVSLATKRPEWNIIATDISPPSLQIAQQNAQKHAVAERITFLHGDLFQPLQNDYQGKCDWIVSNPPYIASEDILTLAPEIKHEPRIALDGGADGLAFICRLIAEAPDWLAPRGCLAFEFGYNQRDSIVNLIESPKKYADYTIIKDYADIDRVIIAQVGT